MSSSVQKNLTWNLKTSLSSGTYTFKSLLLENVGLSNSGAGLHITNYLNIPYVDLRAFHTEVDASFEIEMTFRENISNNSNYQKDMVYFCFGNIFKTHSGGHVIVYRDYSKKALNGSYATRPRICTISRTTGMPLNGSTYTYAGGEFPTGIDITMKLIYDSGANTLTLVTSGNQQLDIVNDVSLSIGYPFLYLGTSTWYTFGGWNFTMDKADVFAVNVFGTEAQANIQSVKFTSGAL